jgi:hypothetical protein
MAKIMMMSKRTRSKMMMMGMIVMVMMMRSTCESEDYKDYRRRTFQLER